MLVACTKNLSFCSTGSTSQAQHTDKTVRSNVERLTPCTVCDLAAQCDRMCPDQIFWIAEVRIGSHCSHDNFALSGTMRRDVVLCGSQQIPVSRRRLDLEGAQRRRRVVKRQLQKHLLIQNHCSPQPTHPTQQQTQWKGQQIGVAHSQPAKRSKCTCCMRVTSVDRHEFGSCLLYPLPCSMSV